MAFAPAAAPAKVSAKGDDPTVAGGQTTLTGDARRDRDSSRRKSIWLARSLARGADDSSGRGLADVAPTATSTSTCPASIAAARSRGTGVGTPLIKTMVLVVPSPASKERAATVESSARAPSVLTVSSLFARRHQGRRGRGVCRECAPIEVLTDGPRRPNFRPHRRRRR